MASLKFFSRSARKVIAKLLRYFPGNSSLFGPPRHILNSTPVYCTTPRHKLNHSCLLTPLQPKRYLTRQSPCFADVQIANLFNDMQSGIIKEQFVVQLERGRYWGRTSGYIVNSSDCLHRDLSPSFEDISSNSYLSHTHDGLQQPFLPPLRFLNGSVAALNTPFSSNFHHWLLDCVPKFGLLQAAGFKFSDIDFFILPKPSSAWHIEVLNLLEIPLEKVISSSSSLHICADHLIVPSFSEPSRQPEKYNYTPEGLNFVRELILNSINSHNLYPEKIIVSREKTSCRRLIDSNTIHPQLVREGFEVIVLEDFSLVEQAMIFNQAKTIIMPTGGGLANLNFCKYDTKIIELFSPYYMPTFSLLLATHLNLNYFALVGESLADTSTHYDLGASQDIRIPLERLLEFALD